RWPGVPSGKIQFGVALGGSANVTAPPFWGVPPLADDPCVPEEHPAASRVAATPSTASGVRAAAGNEGDGLFIGAPDGRYGRRPRFSESVRPTGPTASYEGAGPVGISGDVAVTIHRPIEPRQDRFESSNALDPHRSPGYGGVTCIVDGLSGIGLLLFRSIRCINVRNRIKFPGHSTKEPPCRPRRSSGSSRRARQRPGPSWPGCSAGLPRRSPPTFRSC